MSSFFLRLSFFTGKIDTMIHTYKSIEKMEGNYICKQFRFVLGICMPAKSLQSYPILCDPMDYSPPGSSVHGILQARILDWVAMPSSRGSFPTQELNQCLLHLLHWQAGS